MTALARSRQAVVLLACAVLSVSLAGCGTVSDSWVAVVADEDVCWKGESIMEIDGRQHSTPMKGCGSKRYRRDFQPPSSVYVKKTSGDSPLCIELQEGHETVRAACTTSPSDASVVLWA